MQLIRFDDIYSFEKRVIGFLLQREAENCFLLGLISNLKKNVGKEAENPFLVSIEDNGEVVSVAMRTAESRPLAISRLSKEEIELISDFVAKSLKNLNGVVGPASSCEALSGLLAERLKCKAKLHMGMKCFYLDKVEFKGKASGKFRLAEKEDQDLVLKWTRSFIVEALKDNSPKGYEDAVKRNLEEERFFIWEDEKPVTMALVTGHTPHGIRITDVYTPVELRNHGYATSCVAALSQHWLDQGKKFCFLFTDILNPTSNAIYQRIGYKPICDFSNFRFD